MTEFTRKDTSKLTHLVKSFFEVGKQYRIAYTIEHPMLRGQPCIFLRWETMQGDIERVVVQVGGAEYAINPHFVIGM